MNHKAMMQPHLIQAILNEPWAIQPEWVSAYAHLIDNVFSKNLEFEKAEPVLPELLSFTPMAFDDGGDSDVELNSSAIQLSVIRITGAMTKYDQRCGPAGMLTVASWIQAAINNPEVNAIILRIDSPGGMVAGTETLASVVQSSKKPILAFVDDLAASAAYWVASQCNEIIANNTTAQIGSIGVVSTFQDMQPALEKQGVKFHIITAPQSVNKTRLFDKVRAGDYEEYKEKILRPLAQKFIDQVTASRPGITADQTNADVFFAKDVISTMVDYIGNFDFAIQRAALLVNAQSKATKQTQAHSNLAQNTMNKPDFTRLAKAAGVPQLESADGTITLSADMALAVQDALAASDTSSAALQQQLNARADQQQRITQLEADLQTRDARIAELSNEAGAENATVNKSTDAIDAAAEGDDFYSRIGRLRSEFSTTD
jgi:ClpP class serine protease